MNKRKKVIIMSIALSPLVAVSCWLLHIEQFIGGAAVFCIVVIFGNWYTLRIRKSQAGEAKE